MCISNHKVMARPGYLIDAPIASIAAEGALFTRLLAHYQEIGLSCEQIKLLLDINREYHERQVAIQLEFARISEDLEIKRGRIDEAEIAAREKGLRRHAQLFLEHELLFFEMTKRGHDVLTDEQIERAETIYHAEKDEMLEALLPSLNRAVGPNFAFSGIEEERQILDLVGVRYSEPVLTFGGGTSHVACKP